jgi:hypothetical protein
MSIALDSLEANPRIRYGFYLRPSYEMCRAQAEMHDLLRRVFGLETGGKFMPHVTIMSFFRSDATLATIKAAIDPVMAGRAPFLVHNRGLNPHGRTSVTLDVHHKTNRAPNQALFDLHEAAFQALIPLVHPDCEFAFRGWSGDNFRAHLTLAMADIPDSLFDEVRAFVNEALPIGPVTFTAEWFHLYAFDSDAWDGRWWETMTWKDLASWRLDP